MKIQRNMPPSRVMTVPQMPAADFWRMATLAVAAGVTVSLIAAGVVLFITTVGA
jgi:hypothetical protein